MKKQMVFVRCLMCVVDLSIFGLLFAPLAIADTFPMYAQTVPAVDVWVNEGNAAGEPYENCSDGACCAYNESETSALYLEGQSFQPPFVLPANHRIISVVVSALTRYDANSTDCEVRLRVRSEANPDFPTTTSALYTWNQGNNENCNWARLDDENGWNITHLFPVLDESSVNHFRVALRRYAADDPIPPTRCRVNAFRVIVTTEPVYECGVNPTVLNFGEQTPGTSTQRTFIIQNAGTGTLAGNVTSNCAAYSVLDGGPFALQANQIRTFTVQYSPPAVGTYSCVISLGNADCPGVWCTGVGAWIDCEISPESIDFGDVDLGDYWDEDFSITNIGDRQLTGIVTENCPAFSVSNGAYDLAPGEEQTVTVRFQPQVAGATSCTISTGSLCLPVECEGNGIDFNDPVCSLEPEDLDFGDVFVGVTRCMTFRIYNRGGGILNGIVSRDTDCSGQGYRIDSGGGAYSLSAGQYREVRICFSPQDENNYTCTILTGDDCSDFECDGWGTYDPVCPQAPDFLDCGELQVGETRDAVFQVYNGCNHTLTGSVSESCDAFSIISGASYSIPPYGDHAVVVRFQPTAPGDYECEIDYGSEWGWTVTAYGSAFQDNVGACCFDQLPCRVISEVDCDQEGGNWMGAGTACESCASVGVPPEGSSDTTMFSFANPYSIGSTMRITIQTPVATLIEVFDLRGARVATLVNDRLAAGEHVLTWDGRDDQGRRANSGVYLVRGRLGHKTIQRKVALLR